MANVVAQETATRNCRVEEVLRASRENIALVCRVLLKLIIHFKLYIYP